MFSFCDSFCSAPATQGFGAAPATTTTDPVASQITAIKNDINNQSFIGLLYGSNSKLLSDVNNLSGIVSTAISNAVAAQKATDTSVLSTTVQNAVSAALANQSAIDTSKLNAAVSAAVSAQRISDMSSISSMVSSIMNTINNFNTVVKTGYDSDASNDTILVFQVPKSIGMDLTTFTLVQTSQSPVLNSNYNPSDTNNTYYSIVVPTPKATTTYNLYQISDASQFQYSISVPLPQITQVNATNTELQFIFSSYFGNTVYCIYDHNLPPIMYTLNNNTTSYTLHGPNYNNLQFYIQYGAAAQSVPYNIEIALNITGST